MLLQSAEHDTERARVVIFCPSGVASSRCGRIERSGGRVLSAAPAADVQRFRSPWWRECYRECPGAAPPRRVPAWPNRSACAGWRRAAVAMGRLNTSCCVHGGWEPRCVHGPSEKDDVVREAEAPPTWVDESFELRDFRVFVVDLEMLVVI